MDYVYGKRPDGLYHIGYHIKANLNIYKEAAKLTKSNIVFRVVPEDGLVDSDEFIEIVTKDFDLSEFWEKVRELENEKSD